MGREQGSARPWRAPIHQRQGQGTSWRRLRAYLGVKRDAYRFVRRRSARRASSLRATFLGPAVAVYDYEGFSRLAGPLGEAPANGRYRVGVRPLRRAHPRRAVAGTAGVVLAQGSFIAWLLLHGVGNPLADRSVSLGLVSIFMVVAILTIELFRLVNLGTLTLATAWARDPVPVPPEPGLRVAFLTTIVPSREPIEMVRRTLEAALRIRHDGPLDVWLLDEGNSRPVRRMCDELSVRHFSRRRSQRLNQPSGRFKAGSKHGNYNAWVDRHGAEYDVIVSVDPDHVPLESYCERMLGYFRDPDVAFVVGPQVYGNYDNLVTKCAESQQFVFHGLIQRMGNRFGCSMLVGTNNAIRLSALRSIGGLSDSITEDIASSLAFHGSRNPQSGRPWRSVYTPDVLAVGEGPANFTDFFCQQDRWSRGTFEVLRGPFWRTMARLTWGPRLHYALIASYYPSAAIGWVFGAVNCVLYLTLGATGVSLAPQWWVLVYVDLAFVQFCLYWANRRHNVSPHEAEGSAGGAGMFITVLSAPVYAAALIQTVLKRSATFVVTPKGGAASRDSRRTFRHHLFWAGILATTLAISFWLDRPQSSMRLWSLTLLAVCLMPPAIWTYQQAWRRLRSARAARSPLPEGRRRAAAPRPPRRARPARNRPEVGVT